MAYRIPMRPATEISKDEDGSIRITQEDPSGQIEDQSVVFAEQDIPIIIDLLQTVASEKLKDEES